MYCPRCEKNIPKERIEQVDMELRRRFNIDSLGRGLCPVCGTPLIELKEERDENRRDDQ